MKSQTVLLLAALLFTAQPSFAGGGGASRGKRPTNPTSTLSCRFQELELDRDKTVRLKTDCGWVRAWGPKTQVAFKNLLSGVKSGDRVIIFREANTYSQIDGGQGMSIDASEIRVEKSGRTLKGPWDFEPYADFR